MPIGGKLCLSHRRCSEELDPMVVNFLVPAYWLFWLFAQRLDSALHLYPASQ
jgi:hypothetical protein